MASALEQEVMAIQLNNYMSLLIIVAVGYDYILAFPEEVEYIWNKPWTRVSALYFLARYSGLCYIVINMLFGSSFLPGPVKAYVFIFRLLLIDFLRLIIFDRCEIFNTSVPWIFTVFIGAADLAMILRVWLLYKKSVFILRALLVIYVIEIVLRLVSYAVTDTVESLAPVIIQVEVLDFSFCILQAGSRLDNRTGFTLDILQIILGGLMCLLVGVRFIQQSLQMYRATKRFEVGRYTNLFTREGILYFVAILSYAITNVLDYIPIPALQESWSWAILCPILQFVPTFTLTPRLILTLRKLYAHVPNRHESDTSTPSPFTSMDSDRVQADTSLFAPARQREGTEQGEEIQMVERESRIACPSRV